MEIIQTPNGMFDYQIIKMIGDGNCLFRAISYLIYNCQEKHLEVRMSIVKYICANWNKFKLLTVNAEQNVYNDANEYYNSMSVPGIYGSISEVIGASIVFNINILVYNEKKLIIDTKSISKNPLESTSPTVSLKFSGNLKMGHFDVLGIPKKTSHEVNLFGKNIFQ